MRVVIGEDEALLRAGISQVLSSRGFDVVAEARDGDEVLRLATDHDPELVITDIRMPPTHTDEGLRAAMQIRRRLPHVGLVVLSQHLQRAYAVDLLSERSSGVGYLLKQRIADVESFVDDLRRVARGGTVLDPEVVSLMVARARGANAAIDELTPRQLEVLALLAEGRSNAAIARKLSITDRAVVQVTTNIYDHLGLPESNDEHRRVLAAIRFLTRS